MLQVASLERSIAGIQSTLAEAPVFYMNPSIRHQITVVSAKPQHKISPWLNAWQNDQGIHGPVEVLVDDRVVISYHMPLKGKK